MKRKLARYRPKRWRRASSSNLLSRFARIPALRLAIISCFDQSVDMADDITAVFGKSPSPNHILRVVEEMRSMVLGDGKPKSLV
jgi:hypothetical protein